MVSFTTKNDYNVIGIMSGTSLDGLDIALCRFIPDHKKWKYEILKAETYSYDDYWRQKLSSAMKMESQQLLALHHEYGSFIGGEINRFLGAIDIKPDFISSHGHTIFHQPENGFTFQLGYGGNINVKTGLPVVSDFRTEDILFGGQGAPLVPVGDEFLFGEYDYCLNLGGFCNVSYATKDRRMAYDICPCNMALNYMASKLGFEMDKDGELAKSAKINKPLLEQLNALHFYAEKPPKSLGREWFENYFLPVIESAQFSENTLLRTITEHIAFQISGILNKGKTLMTGGGVHNRFLVDLIKQKSKSKIIIPSQQIINFKEALIFAFLGLRRIRNEINTFSSVTGASKDLCTGIIFDS